jgi:hypothetical protein
MSDQDETLNIVADVVRVVVLALASAARSDMGAVADAMKGLGASPQFDPKARKILTALAQEFDLLRSPE